MTKHRNMNLVPIGTVMIVKKTDLIVKLVNVMTEIFMQHMKQILNGEMRMNNVIILTTALLIMVGFLYWLLFGGDED